MNARRTTGPSRRGAVLVRACGAGFLGRAIKFSPPKRPCFPSGDCRVQRRFLVRPDALQRRMPQRILQAPAVLDRDNRTHRFPLDQQACPACFKIRVGVIGA